MPTLPVVCRFYQQGNCRNGSSCRFEHPGANTGNPFLSNTSTNRFGALGNGVSKTQEAYKITKDGIKSDLTDERPNWILSSYGPGKDAPEQLFGGAMREQSLEEMMVYVRGAANQQQAMSEVRDLYTQAENQIRETLNNLDGAMQFALAAENNHPNRIDICKQNTREGGTTGLFARKEGFADNPLTTNPGANQNPFSTNTQANPFGASTGATTSAFGQPSTMGQKPNPFGAPAVPAFGQTSQMGAAAPAFGQPSQMGAAAPAFGQPSQMGVAAPAFGQPSQMGAAAPAFGQTSALGQKPNPFGAAAAPAQSTFGQPSAMGQNPNPFGAPSATTANPFGQPNNPTPAAANPFAQAAASTASPFAQAGAASNPFAQTTPVSNDQSMDTSAPGPARNNPFGQPQPATQNNGSFGTVQPSMASNAPFGHAISAPAQAPQSQNNPYPPGSSKSHPTADTYIDKQPNGRIMTFKNQPVQYKWKVEDRYQDEMPQMSTEPPVPVPGVRRPDGTWSKILFPDGAPPYYKDTEPDPAQYDTKVKEAYTRMALTGKFQGDMPEVPPMREDCVWTF
ncbi:hypothetical protein F5Y16DRAFT_394575 [Xylariaceae sp. FL0255]|nr:hypothetical protein F5Y16DRAFT_394575 [Xylariaceae sp. FL0255]